LADPDPSGAWQPGRYLDAAVYERLFAGCPYDGSWISQDVPHFSTSWADSGRVMEILEREGVDLSADCVGRADPDRRWTALLMAGGRSTFTYGPSLCYVLCVAALEWADHTGFRPTPVGRRG
jgi:hypothetical protein